SNVRLVFEVAHPDLEHRRLTDLGANPSAILENQAERYREFRLVDPDETPVTLFAWLDEVIST
ncbi:MAG TPA: VOC family protein, partial [Isosphaeraceae bacterium]|nr:VOC family protein [Isosphaeraceae bacterium]